VNQAEIAKDKRVPKNERVESQMIDMPERSNQNLLIDQQNSLKYKITISYLIEDKLRMLNPIQNEQMNENNQIE
jgi:hypothetical protein